MTTSPRRTTHDKKLSRSAERSTSRSSLVLAELSYQRGDVAKALQLLKRLRLQNQKSAFKEDNLYGCSLGLSLDFPKAIKEFEKLSRKHRTSGLFYEKARFNLGLIHFFRDLSEVGDLTITRQAINGNNLFEPNGFQPSRMNNAFEDAVALWEELLPDSKHYTNIVLTYLAFAALQQGDLQKALDYIVESLTKSKNFHLAYYVAGRLFLDFYFLTEDQIHFTLDTKSTTFFGIEKEEGEVQADGRIQVDYDTLIRVAYECFFEGFQMNPNAPEICLGLVTCCFLTGNQEDLFQYLAIAESMIPESKVLLDLVYWLVRESLAPPGEMNAVLRRLNEAKIHPEKGAFHVISPYFLL